ncbi:MAG: flippase [Chlorobium sp.]|nr:flippase [Chlorobium sp.]
MRSLKINTIFKNSSIGILQNVFNIIVSVFINGYIAGKLGTGEYGKFIFAFAFPQVFSVIADFGLQGYYTKKIAAHREATRAYLGEMILLRMGLSCVAVFLAVGSLTITGHSADTKTAVLIGMLSVLIAQTLITNAWTVFQAHEDVKYVAVSNIMSRIIIALLSIVVLQFGGGLLEITSVYAMGYVIQVLYCLHVLRKEGWTPIFSVTRGEIAGIFKEALPFSLFGVFSYLALSIDKTMLSLISGDDSLGIYNAASSLCTSSFMVSLAVATAVFPTLVQSFRQNRLDEFSRKMQIILKWMLLLGMPLALIIAFYGYDIILFIYRNDSYKPSVIVLQILIWMLPIDLISRVLRYALIAANREHSVTIYYGLGLALNVLLNFILIPEYSYVGAAYAAIITQTFLLAVQVVLYFRSLQMGISLPYFKIVFGNATLLGALWLWSTKVYWMAGIVLSVVFFAVQMVALGVVRRQDFAAILVKKNE